MALPCTLRVTSPNWASGAYLGTHTRRLPTDLQRNVLPSWSCCSRSGRSLDSRRFTPSGEFAAGRGGHGAIWSPRERAGYGRRGQAVPHGIGSKTREHRWSVRAAESWGDHPMTFRLRALRVLVLVIGFFQIGVTLLATMAVLDWLMATRLFTAKAAWFEGAVLTLTILLALAILRGMLTFLRAGRLAPVPHGVAVKPEDQPELWEQVRAAAEATGERPPDELYLVADVNAEVAEQRRLLGLLPGRRRMLLGLPLLAV